MSRRSPETLADYLVVAVCPALIMLLVGSLMWFLVEVFYQGEFKLRLLWVMAMFVLGIVGIARISMERGLAYAAMFGWALAAAIAMALAQFVKDGLVLGGPLMVLVWWAAHKLTWDCTLIDDSQDASGQGLLQQMGLDPSAPPPDRAPPGTTTRPGDIGGTTTERQEPQPPWWETLLEPDRRPHAPGVWVVYFSLAALPLFGIGGWFVPASDPVARARVFGLLVIYVASGMGLLLATSFLGLRRYLRQRKLEMPVEMTSTWIVAGIVMIIAMLLVATILPRPSREYSLSQLPFTVTSAVRRASRIAFGKGGTKDDQAKNAATTAQEPGQTTQRQGDQSAPSRGGQSTAGGKSGSGKSGSGTDGSQGKASSDSAKSPSAARGKSGKRGQPGQGGKSSSQPTSSDQSANNRDAEANAQDAKADDSSSSDPTSRDQQASDQQQTPDQSSPPQQSNADAQSAAPQSAPPSSRWSPSRVLSQVTSLAGQAVFTFFRWVFYAVLIVGLVIAAIIYRDELAAAWQKLLAELRDLWDSWFGKKKTVAAAPALAEPLAPPRPFASFSDPFLTGDANRMPWPRLVRYSFDALEAWGRDHGQPREIGQTPHEYALLLASNQPAMAGEFQSLAASYNQLAFAKAAGGGSPESLRSLWHNLRSHSAVVAGA